MLQESCRAVAKVAYIGVKQHIIARLIGLVAYYSDYIELYATQNYNIKYQDNYETASDTREVER